MGSRQALPCDTVRELVSRSFDCAPSELEQRLIASHVTTCDPCAAFAGDVEAIVTALRAARLEPVPSPIAVSRRSLGVRVRVRPVLQSASVAAAFVAVVTIGLAQRPAVDNAAGFQGTTISDPTGEGDQVRELNRHGITHGELQIVAGPTPTGLGAVKPILLPTPTG
jgi:predicted anti-sigma-YlaC factor YlaD